MDASRLTMPFMCFHFRSVLLSVLAATLVSTALSAARLLAADSPRPNILWIMSEDNSKHYLRHFDRHGAVTPNIEALAQNGVTFDRAFSCAPSALWLVPR